MAIDKILRAMLLNPERDICIRTQGEESGSQGGGGGERVLHGYFIQIQRLVCKSVIMEHIQYKNTIIAMYCGQG